MVIDTPLQTNQTVMKSTLSLRGWPLSFMVAKCAGVPVDIRDGEVISLKDSYAFALDRGYPCEFHRSWDNCGPIIQKEGISFSYDVNARMFTATLGEVSATGSNRLLAAMRAFVLSAMGDEVPVPATLV